MKPNIFVLFVFLLISISSCKKELPHYPISDDMKQFFAYQKGSYWIYQNDSTMMLDSTYVNLYAISSHDNLYSGKTRELITMCFSSYFLNDFQIGYNCPGPNCLTIANVYSGSGGDVLKFSPGPIAFAASWPSNTEIKMQDCIGNYIFSYRIIPEISINNNHFENVIISRISSIDSSSNPQFFFREILFAKQIGIIKYVETYTYLNTHRSFSIIRFKVIQ